LLQHFHGTGAPIATAEKLQANDCNHEKASLLSKGALVDVQSVAKRIEELIDPQSPAYKAAAAKRYHDGGIDKGWLALDLSDTLESLIASQGEFANQPARMLRCGSGAGRVDASSAARSLLYAALDGESPTAVVQAFAEVLAMTKASGSLCLALWGITTPSAVQLPNDVTLMPFDSLPSSREKETVDSEFREGWPRRIFQKLDKPQSALTKKLVMDPLFSDVSGDELFSEFFSASAELSATALALTAIGPSAPIQAISWYAFDDARIKLVSHGSGLQIPFLEILPMPFLPITALDQSKVAAIVPAIVNLKGRSRAKVDTALTRLNRAIRRHTTADKAIDLAIAFESLLVDDAGENTFKVHTRTGLIAQGSESQKLRARAVTKALYKLRSQAAHQGECTDRVSTGSGEKEKSADIVGEAVKLCAELICEVAKRLGLPDWTLCDLDSTKGWPKPGESDDST
jgi:hypothetical protein